MYLIGGEADENSRKCFILIFIRTLLFLSLSFVIAWPVAMLITAFLLIVEYEPIAIRTMNFCLVPYWCSSDCFTRNMLTNA